MTENMIDHNGFQDPKEANRLAAKIAEVHGVAGRFLIEWMMQNPEDASSFGKKRWIGLSRRPKQRLLNDFG